MTETKKDFGVLYGQKTTEDALLIYSSYEDSKASPKMGDFIVLAPRTEDGQKFLARVEAEIYDEDPIFRNQDKTLIAVHYARISQRELSDRDKQKMFSYTYKVKILGSYTISDGKDFTTAVRKLPTVSYHARHLTHGEITNILNRTNEHGEVIGFLCIGEDFEAREEIKFDISKLKEKRTLVLAQSGFGKTNLMKVLIYSTLNDESCGRLIFDLNGEYFARGEKTYGLGDVNETKVRDRLVVYTDRKEIAGKYENRFIHGGDVKVNFSRDFTINDIFQASVGLTNAAKTFLNYLDSLPTGNEQDVQEFISKILTPTDSKAARAFAYRKFSSFFEAKVEKAGDDDDALEATVKQETKSMLGGVIRQIRSFSSIHDPRSDLVEKVLEHLSAKKTVVIDLSLKDNQDASLIATALVRRLFSDNKQNFTSGEKGKVRNAVIFVEEAQNVLSEEFVRTNANPFVRVAKEGRKFGLGLVAVTQRPSAISEEIRSQAENFFAFYMGNTKDIRALVESNLNFDGVISRFLQSETISGNLYMVSSGQSFALPLRVRHFEQMVHQYVYPDMQLDEFKKKAE